MFQHHGEKKNNMLMNKFRWITDYFHFQWCTFWLILLISVNSVTIGKENTEDLFNTVTQMQHVSVSISLGNQSTSRCTISITEQGFCCLDHRSCPCWLIPLESQNWSGLGKTLNKNQTLFLPSVFDRHKYQRSSSPSHIHPERSPKLRHVGP